MSESNPLIASAEDSTQWYSGVTLFESVADLGTAISSGSWIETGVGLVASGMEVAAMVVDPAGTLAGFGVGFLIEHVQPLQDALNWVAGDPDQIEAYAKTWENVAGKISETAAAHKSAVDSDVADWQGSTASAYESRAGETADALSSAAEAASAASQAIRMAGGVVAAVRMTVRDIVSQAVGRLAVWAAEALFSLGTATPLIIVQAQTYVAETLTTITTLFRKLAKTMEQLTPLLRRLKEAFSKITAKLGGKGSRSVDTTPSGAKPRKAGEDTSTNPASAETEPSATETAKPDTPQTGRQPDANDAPTTPSGVKTPDEPNSTPSNRAENDSGVGDKAVADGPKSTRTPQQVKDCGDPVDAATGEFLFPQTDVELPGVLSLVLGRRHRSNYRHGRWFGPSWSATLDMRVVVEQRGVTFVGADGVLLVYPHTAPGATVLPVNGGQRWTMTRAETGEYRVFDPDRESTWHFAPDPVLRGLDERLGNYAITAITDRHGNRIEFRYGLDGAPVEVSHSGGYRVRVRTAADRVTGLYVVGATDEAMVREFGYEAGRLTSVTNGVGARTTYTYDRSDRMLSWTDSRGTQLHNTYRDGRVIEQRGTEGILSTRFAYETRSDGVRTEFTDSLGATTVFEFDTDLNPRDTIDPTGARTHTDYDRDRRPIRHVTADSATTLYHYTSDGEPAKITRPDGAAITIDYAARARPSRIVDVDGSVTTREYDADGNLSAVVAPGGIRTEYALHANGAVAAVTESTGARTTAEVDGAGLPVRVTDPYGAVRVIDRDHFGRPVTVTDALGARTHYEWSAEGNLLRRTDPDGHTETWRWDGEGNLLTHTDRAAHTTTFTYGAFDRLLSRTDPDDTTTHFGWDTERRLLAVHNPVGDTWTYGYDPAGRLTTETDYNGATTTYSHDPIGRLATTTAPTGTVRYHTHDLLGRLTQIRADSGEWVRYTHDIAGRLTTATTGTGHDTTHTVEFTRTTTGDIATQRVDDRPPTTFGHDTHGRRISRTTPTGATTTWHPDPTGRITTLTTDGHTVGFTHDPLGRTTGWQLGALDFHQTHSPTGHITRRELTTGPLAPGQAAHLYPPHPDRSPTTGPVADGSGEASSRPRAGSGVDGFGEPSTQPHAGTGADRSGPSTRPPGVDPFAHPSSDGPFGEHATFPAGQHSPPTPVHPTNPPDRRLLRREDYTWRPDGYPTAHTTTRRDHPPTHRDYTLDPLGRVTTITTDTTPTERYTYDALSNITTATTAPSAPTDHREYRNNLLIRDGRTRYFYDRAGRLIRKDHTRLSRKPDIWHYRYNAFDQLTDIYTPDHHWWHYTYDAFGRRLTKQLLTPDGTVLERTDYTWDTTHLIEQSTPTTTTHWTHHPDTYTPLTQSTTDQHSTDREFFAIITDLVGTPTELRDPTTAAVAATAAATLWGTMSWTGSASTPLRFPGQIHDAESDLHHSLYRVYNPEVGRFLTTDPLGLAPSPNPIGYPHNPTRWADPLGLTACDHIALGVRGRVEDFAEQVGARHLMDDRKWLTTLKEAIANPNVRFSVTLDDVEISGTMARGEALVERRDPLVIIGGQQPRAFDREMYLLRQADAFDRVTFYEFGREAKNPFV